MRIRLSITPVTNGCNESQSSGGCVSHAKLRSHEPLNVGFLDWQFDVGLNVPLVSQYST